MPDRPKILLIDLFYQTSEGLKADGWAVTDATFGGWTPVARSSEYVRVIPHHLPIGASEQDIVVIDLFSGAMQPNSVFQPPLSVDSTCCSCETGLIDSRPLSTGLATRTIDRIIDHGGVLIVFVVDEETVEYVIGKEQYARTLHISDRFERTTWEFSTRLSTIRSESDRGVEISMVRDEPLARQLESHFADATYLSTLSPSHNHGWIPLATNRYGQIVAAALPPSEAKRGWVFLLPHAKDKLALLRALLREILPGLCPSLFSGTEGDLWAEALPYEIPAVLALRGEIELVREAMERRIGELEVQMAQERDEHGFLHTLLTGTGDQLVGAVHKTLLFLGFEKVVDVDSEMERLAQTAQRREDIQIFDRDTVLILEVKGISGFPSDEDALAVQKYVPLRMREWKKTEIQGLAVINHQRNLPALERDNLNPFRPEIVVNAEDQVFGLMTTWDLFRLARNRMENDWPVECVKDVLYSAGRIEPIPSHYRFLGIIERFIPDIGVAGISVTGTSLVKGSRIAFELPVTFHEQAVESLQLENAEVEEAPIGVLAGISTNLSKQQLRIGTRVFSVLDASALRSRP
jgi:hypothetical protein